MATRTAPAVTGAETIGFMSLTWVDASFRQKTYTVPIPAGATDAEIEAYAAGAQLLSNASLFEISTRRKWVGAKSSVNADDLVVNSVFDHLFVTAKDVGSNNTRRYEVPAPLDALFASGTRTVDIANANYVAFKAAIAPLLDSYAIQTVNFTQNREINQPQSA